MIQTMLLRNRKGFTLVELMAAMVIMLIGLLGLLQAVNIAMEHNLKNQMRNEVTRVSQEAMNDMRTRPFDSVSAVSVSTVGSRLRNINRQYKVTKQRFPINDVSSKYQVDVKWLYKNVSTTQSVMSVRSRTE